MSEPGLSPLDEALAEAGRTVTRSWWLFIITGVLWIIYAFVVLSVSVETVWAVAILFGVGFIAGGFLEFVIASSTRRWRWVHILFGVISIIAGIVALVWPGQTFLVLAAVTGWCLMLDGIINLVVSVSTRDVNDLWWLGLILGIAEILIGFWAVGYVGRSIALLIVFVAAAALSRGISALITAFTLHGADKELRRTLDRSAASA